MNKFRLSNHSKRTFIFYLLIFFIISLAILSEYANLLPGLQTNTSTHIPSIEHHSPPTTIIEQGSGIETASYIVFKDDEGIVYAKNGSNGAIDYSGADLGVVINDIIGSERTYVERKALQPLTVVVRYGNYTVTEKILINRKHLKLDFSFSNIYSLLLPWLEVDGHEFVWDSTEPNLNDLIIENFHATFIGTVQDGAFVYVHDVHWSRQYSATGDSQMGGALEFRNWDLTGKFRYNDYAFIGLKIGATEGAHFQSITGQLFGAGIEIVYIAPWQASHNVFDLINWREANYGVYYTSSSSVTNDVWNNPKIMNTGNSAFDIESEIAGMIINGLQVEGFYGRGITSKASSISLINPLFSTSSGVGNAGEDQQAIYLPYTGSVQHYVKIENPQIYIAQTGIYTEVDTTVTGAHFTSVTTPLNVSGSYYKIHGWENHGSGAYNNNSWVAHGLNAGLSPSTIILTPRSNVAVWVSDRNATHFQVGVASGTPTIDWTAKV